jgi:hypothetical protein
VAEDQQAPPASPTFHSPSLEFLDGVPGLHESHYLVYHAMVAQVIAYLEKQENEQQKDQQDQQGKQAQQGGQVDGKEGNEGNADNVPPLAVSTPLPANGNDHDHDHDHDHDYDHDHDHDHDHDRMLGYVASCLRSIVLVYRSKEGAPKRASMLHKLQGKLLELQGKPHEASCSFELASRLFPE